MKPNTSNAIMSNSTSTDNGGLPNVEQCSLVPLHKEFLIDKALEKYNKTLEPVFRQNNYSKPAYPPPINNVKASAA